MNTLIQGQLNDIDYLDLKDSQIGELNITGVDAGETESPNIELVKPETYIDNISAGAEILPELVERQDMPTFEL